MALLMEILGNMAAKVKFRKCGKMIAFLHKA
jgi:hypothetical protein